MKNIGMVEQLIKIMVPQHQCDFCGKIFTGKAYKTKENGKVKCPSCPAPSLIYGRDKILALKHSIYIRGRRHDKNNREIEDMLAADPKMIAALREKFPNMDEADTKRYLKIGKMTK